MGFRVLELFSGIGGMHFAWKETGIDGHIIAAVDINTVANAVYSHNFKDTNVLNRNIQSLSVEFINDLRPDIILMSPPCQPFTRNGLKKDSEDKRTCSFSHLLSILKDLLTVNFILMENVKGFEESNMRSAFIDALTEASFSFEELLLSPTQFGVPNSRLRYYCLARKTSLPKSENKLLTALPDSDNTQCFDISHVLDDCADSSVYLLKKHLKRVSILDICFSNSKRSCCFTKAYTHFLEGTGSVYTDLNEDQLTDVYKKLSIVDNESEEYYEIAFRLKLRFFTPKEVSRLMAFPNSFSFPKEVTDKQRYRLLGNSINVKVVSELIKRLISL